MGRIINNSWLTQDYGCTDYSFEWPRPDCAGGHFHCGLDFGCAFREPVYACVNGRVVRIGSPYLGDQAVTLQSGAYWYLYGHLDQAAVPVGTDVVRGTLLGWADSKGASTGNHLHFSVRTDGDAEVNPYNTINPWPFVEWQDTPPAPPPVVTRNRKMQSFTIGRQLHVIGVTGQGVLLHSWFDPGAPGWHTERLANGLDFYAPVSVFTGYDGNPNRIDAFVYRQDSTTLHAWNVGSGAWAQDSF